MAAKQAPSKVEKTTKAPQKNSQATKAHYKNHQATKAQPKKPPKHSLPTQYNHQSRKNHQ
jgi:hypothetical protein